MLCGTSQAINQAKFTYSLLGKELKKQTKLIKQKKINYVEVGLDAIFNVPTILKTKS